jgi:hypothetical protein
MLLPSPPPSVPVVSAPAPDHHYWPRYQLSCKLLRHLWRANGGSRDSEDEAAAVAYAESGGRRYATHQNAPGNVDKGIWQINDYYWPRLSTYAINANAKAAILIYNKDGWTAWSSVAAGREHGRCGFA